MESKNIKPNFIIAGTARSGTTTLYSYLKQHPEICMSSIKEPEFFSRYYNKGIEWYLRFFFKLNKQSSKKIFLYAFLPRFKHCKNEKLVGEATTRYFHHPKAVERMYKFNPHFKLIFILRNPITRAFSNYVREIQTKGIRERFEKIIKTNHIRRKEYLNPGRYFTHLSRFLKYFSKKQIHIIIFEKFLSNPNKILKNVLSFLGANNTFNFNHNIIKSNPSVMPISLFFQKIIDRFFYHDYNDPVLIQAFKFYLREFLDYFNHIYSWREFPVLSQESKDYLRKYYRDEIVLLEKEFNIDLSIWR